MCLMLNQSKCLRDLQQCFFLASLFFPTVTDCMIGHSVRRRCGVEMLQRVSEKSVEIFTRITHVVAELHVSLAHYLLARSPANRLAGDLKVSCQPAIRIPINKEIAV